jgi:4-amino-4-deoxy-L-arabinose transferase-like glycosyltransferase
MSKKISRFTLIFIVLLLVGILLRTYNHHQWLRFNADQGRDSEVVSSVVEGRDAWPLLGPKAGGTEFKLGGAFYYFEIVSAKVFGNYPDKMAYPDLVTGILCIPLLFFFLRKYFEKNVSLALVAIFAVSNYAIRYARFAWNPNSTPFWTLLSLYAIHEVICEKKNAKFAWATLAGIAIGIGMQLHTTLLLFLPITTIIIFGYLAIKNVKILKYFVVILAMAIFMNAPQLMGEFQSGGRNVKAFFDGMRIKQHAETSTASKVVRATSCWVQGNLDIISGYEIDDKCSFSVGRNFGNTLAFLLGFIFVLGGTLLGFKYFSKEQNADKKLFLLTVTVFTSVSFLVFVKLAFELSVRFYLILIFLPFLLLGFWIKFLSEKFPKRGMIILIGFSVLLIFSNLFFVQQYFKGLSNYDKKDGGDGAITILGEAEAFSNFIVANSTQNKAYLDGDGKILFKAFKSIKYLAAKSKIEVLEIGKKNQPQGPYFYLGTTKDKERIVKDGAFNVLKYQDYGSLVIMLLQNK